MTGLKMMAAAARTSGTTAPVASVLYRGVIASCRPRRRTCSLTRGVRTGPSQRGTAGAGRACRVRVLLLGGDGLVRRVDFCVAASAADACRQADGHSQRGCQRLGRPSRDGSDARILRHGQAAGWGATVGAVRVEPEQRNSKLPRLQPVMNLDRRTAWKRRVSVPLAVHLGAIQDVFHSRVLSPLVPRPWSESSVLSRSSRSFGRRFSRIVVLCKRELSRAQWPPARSALCRPPWLPLRYRSNTSQRHSAVSTQSKSELRTVRRTADAERWTRTRTKNERPETRQSNSLGDNIQTLSPALT